MNDLPSITALLIMRYRAYLITSGVSPSTINTGMSILRKIFKALTELGYLEKNPFISSAIRQEKTAPISKKVVLLPEQLTAMLQANAKKKYRRNDELMRMRNELIVRILYFTAMRRNELANLRWADLKKDGEYHIAVLQETKSGISQKVKLPDELVLNIQTWKKELAAAGLLGDWVLVSLNEIANGKMTGKGINDVVKALGKAIGVEISAHVLRHTAITSALEQGQTLQKVQAYARHASPNTTILYFHDRTLLSDNPADALPAI